MPRRENVRLWASDVSMPRRLASAQNSGVSGPHSMKRAPCDFASSARSSASLTAPIRMSELLSSMTTRSSPPLVAPVSAHSFIRCSARRPAARRGGPGPPAVRSLAMRPVRAAVSIGIAARRPTTGCPLRSPTQTRGTRRTPTRRRARRPAPRSRRPTPRWCGAPRPAAPRFPAPTARLQSEYRTPASAPRAVAAANSPGSCSRHGAGGMPARHPAGQPWNRRPFAARFRCRRYAATPAGSRRCGGAPRCARAPSAPECRCGRDGTTRSGIPDSWRGERQWAQAPRLRPAARRGR